MLGKLPPPYMGPSIATEIILGSSLKNSFDIFHIDTKANESLLTLGKWSLKKIIRNNAIYFKMWKSVLKNKPDLVWVPISQTAVGFIKDSVFILIARLSGKKVMLHLRGSDFKNWMENKASFFTKWYVKRILKSTQGIIVLGNNLKYLFEEYYPAGKIFVVPNGANYKIPVSEKTTGQPVKIIYLGNLQAGKGIEDVLEAMVILKDQFKKTVELTIIGGWRNENTKARCLSLVEQNKLPVIFYPPEIAKEKFKHLAASDIFVFTPRDPEGHPWVIVEAMAAGLPIISTDRGAITESVIHGQNGFIVQSNHPEQIAGKLNELIENPDTRNKMATESRRLYLENFTEEKMVERLVQSFKAVLQ
ncbi:MAG TPA: glycosyltransferase family 4 protein [Bacteroidia bacterium]|nr:glycosyltransferase family 4 protein [Bacteroidia bacterium]